MKKICVVLYLLNTAIASSQNIDCNSIYGGNPKDFSGQKCWMMNYFNWPVWLFNKNQTTENYSVILDKEKINNTFKYNYGKNNFYLDINHVAWGGNWWACVNGGIAFRKNGATKYPTTAVLNWNERTNYSTEQLNQLSPIEKFDIYRDSADYLATKFELLNRGPERKNPENDNTFCGFCNGSRAAGAILPEPKHSVIVKLSNGKEMTFTISDIKALAGAAYMQPAFFFSTGNPDTNTNRIDPNPAIIDIMLRLYLGEYQIPFFMDADYNYSIFNETILGYKRTITKIRPLKSTEKITNATKAIEINALLYLQDEVEIDQSNEKTISVMSDSTKAINKSSNAATYKNWVHKLNYKYILYVDTENKILDGIWIGKPIDYIWAANGNGEDYKSRSSAFAKGNPYLYFPAILDLIKQSTN